MSLRSALSAVLGPRREPEAQPRRFEHRLAEHERARHGAILRAARRARPRRATPNESIDGFLPFHLAARAMDAEEDALAEMVARGYLEARDIGGEAWVRPAVLSVLRVRERGAAA